jgi:hypothetical protein
MDHHYRPVLNECNGLVTSFVGVAAEAAGAIRGRNLAPASATYPTFRRKTGHPESYGVNLKIVPNLWEPPKSAVPNRLPAPSSITGLGSIPSVVPSNA